MFYMKKWFKEAGFSVYYIKKIFNNNIRGLHLYILESQEYLEAFLWKQRTSVTMWNISFLFFFREKAAVTQVPRQLPDSNHMSSILVRVHSNPCTTNIIGGKPQKKIIWAHNRELKF